MEPADTTLNADVDTPTTRTKNLVSDWRKYRMQAQNHILKHRVGTLRPGSAPTSPAVSSTLNGNNHRRRKSPSLSPQKSRIGGDVINSDGGNSEEAVLPPQLEEEAVPQEMNVESKLVFPSETRNSPLSPRESAIGTHQNVIVDALTMQKKDTEEWRQAFLQLQEETRSAALARNDQERHRTNLVRAQVERELALARQKSATLREQVKALELSAEELLEVTKEKDAYASRLEISHNRINELERTVMDLRTANSKLSEGLDKAMLSAKQARDRLVSKEDTHRESLLQADSRASKAESNLVSAEERIRELQEQLNEALRGKADAESKVSTLERQNTMERSVAADKVKEFAMKLQNALTSRDESTHTYQLALEESRKKQEQMAAEIRLLEGNPSEARKLRKKLRRAKKRIAAYEEIVGSNTDELQRQAKLLQKQLGTKHISHKKTGSASTDHRVASLNILLPSSNRHNNNKMEDLALESNVGQHLLFQHALSVI